MWKKKGLAKRFILEENDRLFIHRYMHEQAVRFKYEKIWKRQAFNLVLFKSTACADILELSAGNVVLICFRTNISFSITSFLNTIHISLSIVDEDKRQNNFIHLLSNIVFRWILTNFLLFMCLGFSFISGSNVPCFPIFLACLSYILILNFLLRGHSLPVPFTEISKLYTCPQEFLEQFLSYAY